MTKARILFILLIFILTACGTDPGATPDPDTPPSNPETPDIAGTVSDWTLGETSVAALIYGQDTQAEVATGQVSESGQLSVTLEDEVGDAFLSSFPACDTLTLSDAAAQQNTFSALDVSRGDTDLGRLALASSQEVLTEGLTEVDDFYVQWTYSDRALEIQGSCLVGGTPTAFRYNLTLIAGWNPVTFRLISKEAGGQILELSNGIPDNATWIFAGS